MLRTCKSNRREGTAPSVVFPRAGDCSEVAVPRAHRLAEDHITAVLQAQVVGYCGCTVLHEQEDHRLLGLVAHHGHAVCERGQQRVKGLAPFTWARGKAVFEKEH